MYRGPRRRGPRRRCRVAREMSRWRTSFWSARSRLPPSPLGRGAQSTRHRPSARMSTGSDRAGRSPPGRSTPWSSRGRREATNVVEERCRVREGSCFLLHDRRERLAAPGSTLLLGESRAEQEADQPLGAVEAAPEVVVLASGTVEERAEVHGLEAGELLRLVGLERWQQGRIAGTHADDLDRVPLACVGDRLERVEEDVPVREPEVTDEQLGAPLGAPVLAEREELRVERLGGSGGSRVERLAELLFESCKLVYALGRVCGRFATLLDARIDRRLGEDPEHVRRDVGEQLAAVHRGNEELPRLPEHALPLVELGARRE